MRTLPTYGAMQAATAVGFTGETSPGYSLLGMLWLTAFGLITVVAFHRSTRDHVHHDDNRTVAPVPVPAVVVLTARDDGLFEVQSTTGPVLLCHQLRHSRAS